MSGPFVYSSLDDARRAGVSDREGALEPRAVERQLAHAHAGRMRQRIGERASSGALRGFAGAQKRLAGPVDDVHLEALRRVREAQDRVARPVAAGDARIVEGRGFEARPADRLQDAALDLVLDAVGIDRLAAVDRGDDAQHAHVRSLALDLNFHRDRRIGGVVLVARVTEAASPAILLLITGPAEA